MTKPSIKDFEQIQAREQGLQRSLSQRQMTMLAIGGAIGTGLFLGSGFAISFAGPSVLISYAIGAVIALLLVGCLAEMTVAHPTSGSFGAFAEHYVSPLAGFLVRYAYWAANVLVIGTEVTAIALYMQYWFPGTPAWWWISLFSALLILVNAVSVHLFGSLEYFFSSIKVFAIVVFIATGAWMLWNAPVNGAIGFHNYVQFGGFFPKGWSGMWLAVIVALFSYLSIEMIAVAAGEAQDPQAAITGAFRSALVRLILFYGLTLILVLAILPWNQAGQGKSPFVSAMEAAAIPGAAGIMNFVILIAALSAMNSQLYSATRMLFSLSRGGFASPLLGKLNAQGVPMLALFASCGGIALAALVSVLYPQSSFVYMMAISMFGAMFAWFMIFVTHWCFRRYRARINAPALAFKMWGFPYSSLLGAGLMLALMLTTLWTQEFYLSLATGVPFLLLLSLIYWIWYRRAD
ncbi:amino acid permease [Undibacterium cyanobacteriorum]|uniref:Amino acid permease n=1 Tax=Undibacterium cyanobacteriorum TaxID=3073561 RepID=A0ABY9RJ97_9BURK|nr:amino acid permease [Undibacterium sp. 20NA77.5]WMW80427.1 amino acid permease [Undibacterium sp. 20NA77.5]